MDIHFDKYDENKHADLLGEILFNARIFSKCASDKASLKTTRSVSSCIFNVIALLKAIDSKAGALNDSSVDEYAHIEDDSNLSDNGKGTGILRKRHYLTRARKMGNGLVNETFGVEELHDEVNKGDMVMFEPEQLFRFILKVFKLEEKARQGALRYAITGDAAALTTSTDNAGQCLFGFKIIDDSAIHPCTGDPHLCRFIASEEEEGATVRRYGGAQSIECCVVTGACMLPAS